MSPSMWRGCWCSRTTSSRTTDTADHALEVLRGSSHPRGRGRWGAAVPRRLRSPTPSCASWRSIAGRRRGRRSRGAGARARSARPQHRRRPPSATSKIAARVRRERPVTRERRIVLRFLLSPTELRGDERGVERGRVRAQRADRPTRPVRCVRGRPGEHETIACGARHAGDRLPRRAASRRAIR